MQGFNNPAASIRKGFVGKISAAGAKQKKTVWIFFLIELAAVIVAFVLQEDRFNYFCQIFGCSPIGGLVNMGFGIGEVIGEAHPVSTYFQKWLASYGQWLLASLQYTGLMCMIAAVKASGGNKFFQFLHGIVNTLFSGVLLQLLSEYVLFGQKGLFQMVVNGHSSNPELSLSNPWMWGFGVMILILIALGVLSLCCAIENFLTFLIRTGILGVLAIAVMLLRSFIGSRVNSGGATELEQQIITLTDVFYKNSDTIYWVAAGVFLMGYILTVVNTSNPKAK